MKRLFFNLTVAVTRAHILNVVCALLCFHTTVSQEAFQEGSRAHVTKATQLLSEGMHVTWVIFQLFFCPKGGRERTMFCGLWDQK